MHLCTKQQIAVTKLQCYNLKELTMPSFRSYSLLKFYFQILFEWKILFWLHRKGMERLETMNFWSAGCQLLPQFANLRWTLRKIIGNNITTWNVIIQCLKMLFSKMANASWSTCQLHRQFCCKKSSVITQLLKCYYAKWQCFVRRHGS